MAPMSSRTRRVAVRKGKEDKYEAGQYRRDSQISLLLYRKLHGRRIDYQKVLMIVQVRARPLDLTLVAFTTKMELLNYC